MRIRGWLLVAGLTAMLASGSAHAGSALGLHGQRTVGQQTIDVRGWAVAAGVSVDESERVLIKSTDGALLNRFDDAAVAGNVAVGNILASTNGTSILQATRAWTAGGIGASRAARANLRRLAGPGSTMDQRFTHLLTERKATVEKFGGNDALASAYMNSSFANRIWASPFYDHEDMSSKDGDVGYKYKARGIGVGYDRAFGPITAGAVFTYSRADYDAKGLHDDNTIDNYGFGLYANYYSCTGFFANVFGGYNYGDNDMKAFDPINNMWLTDDNHTNTYWLGGNIGYDFKVSENFTLTPTIGLTWAEAKGSAYTRNGGGAAQMEIGKAKYSEVVLPINLQAAYTAQLDDCSTLTFKAMGGYSYNFRNKGAHVDSAIYTNGVLGTPMTVKDIKPGHGSWNAGVGVKYSRDRFDVGVDYRYYGRSKSDAHHVSAFFGVKF